jgi:hypothetical protein
MAYFFNFPQQSNVENFYKQYSLVAADDNTPIQNNQCIVWMQMWARSARGTGDQSQFYGNWPYIYGGGYNAVPSFSAATNDGTGVLTLYDGTLELNVPSATLQRLLPGYYEIGLVIMTTDQTMVQQLAVGTLPLYNGGVWSLNGPY